MTMHNETAGGFRNYESQLDDAFSLYEDLGIRTIKNGYVSDSGDLAGDDFNHHNQVLVNHHTLVAETAAANRQMLDMHEPIHPTGRRRTYPNLMTREGVKGQEYDSFGDVSPEHHVTFRSRGCWAGRSSTRRASSTWTRGRAASRPPAPSNWRCTDVLQRPPDGRRPAQFLSGRPAVDAAVGEVAQAEWGDIEGFSTAARWANAQGEQYVAIDPNSAAPGATVSWTVEDADEGEYDVHFRYASDAEENAIGADTDRTASVLVNGSAAGQVTFPPTEYWDVWESVSTTVSLSGDEDEIALSLTAEDTGGLNLDAVAVTDTGAPMPEPETAPIRGETVEAFQFIEDVPAAGWDDTRVIDAEIGDYMVTARQKGEEWYLGAMTDGGGRAIDVPLSFLSPASDSNEQGRGTTTARRTGRTKPAATVPSPTARSTSPKSTLTASTRPTTRT